MFTVTVIIPCYNMERTVGDAIRSVQAQTFKNWNLVVVDDGSTDGSWEQILLAIGEDQRCTAIRKENGGVAAARNAAIERSCSEWILPLDADDKLAPRALYEFALAAQQNPDADLIVPWVHHISPEKDWIVRRQWKGYDSLLQNNCLPNSCMFRRAGWQYAGGYRDGTMYEDWEFWIRYLFPEAKVVVVQKPLIEYAVRPGSRVREAVKRHREEVEIIKQLNPNIYGKSRT